MIEAQLPTVRCNNCMTCWHEDDLEGRNCAVDGEPCQACPNCGTDHYLMDLDLDSGIAGTISTARHPVVRYIIGHESGDVFGRDSDYDGSALTVEVADLDDARAMLAAIALNAAPAPAVPDDVAETLAENYRLRNLNASLQAAREEQDRTNKAQRATIEAQAAELARLRSCDMNDLVLMGLARDAAEAELARLREENALMAASLDEEERKHGLSTNGNMWRFWSQQLREYHERRAKERAALTQPTGDRT